MRVKDCSAEHDSSQHYDMEFKGPTRRRKKSDHTGVEKSLKNFKLFCLLMLRPESKIQQF